MINTKFSWIWFNNRQIQLKYQNIRHTYILIYIHLNYIRIFQNSMSERAALCFGSSSSTRDIHGKLVANKFTYLNSNQIVTKYVKNGNIHENKISKRNKNISSHAYNQCEQSLKKFEEDNIKTQNKISLLKVMTTKSVRQFYKNKANCKAQLDNQVAQIQIMTQDIVSKAVDIMNGKNTDVFIRKSLQLFKDEKKRRNTIQKYLEKTKNTRRDMLIKSHQVKKSGQIQRINKTNKNKTEMSPSFSHSNNSTTSFEISEVIKDYSKQKTPNLQKRIKQKTYNTIYQEQRRIATAKAFGSLWQLGFKNKPLQQINKKTPSESYGRLAKKGKIQPANELKKNNLSIFFSPQSNCKLECSKLYREEFKKFQKINQNYLKIDS